MSKSVGTSPFSPFSRLQTDSFRLLLRQQTDKRQTANSKRIKENQLSCCFPFDVSISPSLHVSTSPCLSASRCPCLRVSMAPCLRVSVSPLLCISMSLCLHNTMSPCLHVSMSPFFIFPCLLVFMSTCFHVHVSTRFRNCAIFIRYRTNMGLTYLSQT